MAPFLHHQIILRKLEWVWFEVELGSPKKADEQVDLGFLGREQLRRTLKFTLASTHMHICTLTYKKWNAHQVIPVLDNSVVAWFFPL